MGENFAITKYFSGLPGGSQADVTVIGRMSEEKRGCGSTTGPNDRLFLPKGQSRGFAPHKNRSSGQTSLGGRNAGLSGIDGNRLSQGSRSRFEGGLSNMVTIRTVMQQQVKIHGRIRSDGIPEFFN